MIRRIIDFSEAEEQIKTWFLPDEITDNLRYYALKVAVIADPSKDYIRNLLQAIDDACDLLDKIQVKEVDI